VDQPRSRTQDLASLFLRIGLGVFFLRPGWSKLTSIARVVGLWQRLHLPLPHVFGPIHAVVEFGGALLVILGLFTRLVGALLAVDMIGAELLVKIHTTTPLSQEWLALWISLALLATGAGAFSLDAMRRGRRAGTI